MEAQNNTEVVDHPAAASENKVQPQSKNTFEDLMTNIASKKSTLPRNVKDPIDTLLDEYCDAPVIPMNEDPLMFWKEWAESDNPLKQLLSEEAVEHLTPPPTSTDVERLFSTAGDVATNDRNKLKAENLEKLLFCHNNLPAVNFEY